MDRPQHAHQRALARAAFALAEVGHAEADLLISGMTERATHVRMRVHRRGIQHGDTVPARLDLHRQMASKAMLRLHVAKDRLERRVLEGRAVHVAGNPVVVCRVSLAERGQTHRRRADPAMRQLRHSQRPRAISSCCHRQPARIAHDARRCSQHRTRHCEISLEPRAALRTQRSAADFAR